jgi:hypothetical protein
VNLGISRDGRVVLHYVTGLPAKEAIAMSLLIVGAH